MGRILLRGATVITMAEDRPDFEKADVLIEGDHIVAVGNALDDNDAEVIDFGGRILIPGLINAHLHSWQAALRSVGADWTLLEYLAKAHGGLSSHYTPEDMHIASYACAVNQINCGTTTLGDWCHNARTPEHADAALQGLTEAGIRSVFFHGSSHKVREAAHPVDEIDRLIDGRFFRGPLLTLGMAIPGPQYSGGPIALADFRAARERELVVSMHQSGGRPGASWDAVRKAGLIDQRTNIVHANEMPEDWIKYLVEAGATFTSTPENELSQGHGFPITGTLLKCGGAPSIGTDVDTVLSGEVLIATRIALAHQRGLDHLHSRNSTGFFAPTATISSKQALSWATVEGARALGLSDKVGRLKPGMKADIVAIDSRALNLWPAHNPVATALQASIANIEAVMIGGTWRKFNGALVESKVDELQAQLFESGQRLVSILNSTKIMARLKQKVIHSVVRRTLNKQSQST